MAGRLLLLFLITLSLYSNSQAQSSEIALVSDTQAPMWVETIFLKQNHNTEATAQIFREIDARKPVTLFILGDVVAAGSKEKQWVKMDNYLDATRKAGIPVHAILGNHDIMYSAQAGEELFQVRFPDHQRLGSLFVVDSMAWILLNSNFGSLTQEERARQNNWLKTTLDQTDHDPAILATVVTCHHAPYTNSKVVGMNESVQNSFVPPFLASRKCLLFITGHAHAFERFRIKEKDFLTIGGGGGLHQPLKSGEDALHDEAASYKPQFHFQTVLRTHKQITFVSHALKADFSGFEKGYTFSIPIR